ncbi:MAG: long-chain-fatty-acid--CoA ligase [Proteobacteria bacterium]|nr:long-chain-fatty-acid--CoA ligase [Pseudomonadota bacterium]MBU4470211.1 long-chain-fatty-acid--CoA ligase [Pseudomonadota bacterium]MCG2752627.1 long-chain-fatty-acid--CoA ligase [Desulfobacteraceae bacterium]
MAEKTLYPEYTKHYPLLVKNLMKRPLDLYPDDIALVYRNETGQYFRFTWRQWHERTCQLAHALKALGVCEGDRVATMALNHHWHMENIYAAICSGAVSHPINIRLSLDHMVHTITHSEDKIVFFDEEVKPIVEALYDKIKGHVKAFVYMSEKPGLPETKIEPLYEYEKMIKDYPKTYDWPDLNEDTNAVLYYTTGTTGLPKGALFTNRQVFLANLHLIALGNLDVRQPDDPPKNNFPVVLANVPLFHIHAWQAPFYNVFAASKLIFAGKFTPESFCEVVQSEKVTTCTMVPTMLAMVIGHPDLDKYDLSSLTNITVGGGALPLGLKTKAEKVFPAMKAGGGYGMTETLALALTPRIMRHMENWPEEQIAEIRVKTGIPYPGLEVQVLDENGLQVPKDGNTIGQIVLRGHWITEQYFREPEKSAEVWQGGWFHTGDAAKVDPDGYITIVDRIKDVIRSGAEMVPTVLLENLTSNADFVLEATYVGIPDEKWGEIPMALVKLAPGFDKKEEDILTHLKTEGVDQGKITKWMLPVYVAFVDDVPKTSVGKIDKIAIRKSIDGFMSRAKKVRNI